jgi:hypothetical protein
VCDCPHGTASSAEAEMLGQVCAGRIRLAELFLFSLTIQIDEELGTREVRKLEAKNGSKFG